MIRMKNGPRCPPPTIGPFDSLPRRVQQDGLAVSPPLPAQFFCFCCFWFGRGGTCSGFVASRLFASVRKALLRLCAASCAILAYAAHSHAPKPLYVPPRTNVRKKFGLVVVEI